MSIYRIICIYFLTFADLFSQCAMCKAVVENNQVNNYGIEKLGTGINVGIILLVLGVYIFWFFAFRKKIAPFLKEMNKIYKKKK